MPQARRSAGAFGCWELNLLRRRRLPLRQSVARPCPVPRRGLFARRRRVPSRPRHWALPKGSLDGWRRRIIITAKGMAGFKFL